MADLVDLVPGLFVIGFAVPWVFFPETIARVRNYYASDPTPTEQGAGTSERGIVMAFAGIVWVVSTIRT